MADEKEKWNPFFGKFTFPGELDIDTNKHDIPTGPVGLLCYKCDEVTMLENCYNCDNDIYHLGRDSEGYAGLFCAKCQRGASLWTCRCGTENPVKHDNLLIVKRGCFIATAVYGSENAVEILYLSAFRDEVLNKNSFGEFIVLIYYKISPCIAKIISKSRTLRKLAKYLFIKPCILFLKMIWENKHRPNL